MESRLTTGSVWAIGRKGSGKASFVKRKTAAQRRLNAPIDAFSGVFVVVFFGLKNEYIFDG